MTPVTSDTSVELGVAQVTHIYVWNLITVYSSAIEILIVMSAHAVVIVSVYRMWCVEKGKRLLGIIVIEMMSVLMAIVLGIVVIK